MNNTHNNQFLYLNDILSIQSIIRTSEISNRMIKAKIYPIILTQKMKKRDPFIERILDELNPEVKVYRAPYIRSLNKFLDFILDKFFELDFYIGWIPFAYFKAKKILKKHKGVKFIYATGPRFYTHILSYLLKRKLNIPIIIEYRDPWSLNPYHYKNKRRINEKINLFLEKNILKSADVIITVSEALDKFLKESFPFIKNKRIYTISNGLNIIKQDYKSFQKKENEIIFTYTGSLYGKRTIKPLLQIISNLHKEKFFNDFKFLLKIFGRYPTNLNLIIKKLNIEDLVFLGGYISRSNVLNEIQKCDLAIHVGENLDYPTIAFKVWDYIGCKKKIIYLGNENSFTANFFRKNKLGIVISVNDLLEGKKIIKNLINDLRSNRFSTYIEEQELVEFLWDNKTDKLLEIIINKGFIRDID